MSASGDAREQASESVTRAFLMSDIRGYSSFASLHGDEKASQLARRFAALATEVLTGLGAEILGMAGDDVLAAFASPRAAIRAAVTFQERLLAATEEDPSLPLPAGVGLDFGEAVTSDTGWNANAINVAARLCAQASGGEILATEHLTHVAQVMSDVRYEVLAPISLKGIEKPVRVVRVSGPIDVPTGLRKLGRSRAAALPEQPRRRRPLVAAVVASIVAVAIVVPVVSGGRHAAPLRIPGNALVALNASASKVERTVDVGFAPGAVAADGAQVYVVDPVGGSVTRIDAKDHGQAAQTIAVGHDPSAVSIGEGAAWVTNSADRSVSRINAGAPPRVGDTITVGTDPDAIVTGFGLVWVANAIDGTVSAIDPKGRGSTPADTVVATIPVGAQPDGLAVGLGAVWVANAGSATVSRIDPATKAVTALVPVGAGPAGLAVDDHGVWVANAADGTVSHIAGASASVDRTIPVGSHPESIASRPGGVWVASAGTDALSAIDGASGDVVRSVQVGHAAAAVSAAGGSLWLGTTGSAAAHRGGTLRIVESGGDGGLGADSLDPAVAYSPFTEGAVATMNDGLVTFDRASGPAGALVVPDLAVQLPAVAADGRSYTFQLRSTIAYSNGAPVKASDVRASFERMLRLSKVGPYYYGTIVGASACTEKVCDLSQGVVADDATGAVVVHLTKADPDLLTKLALPFASILPAGTPMHDLGFAPHPATGPYMIGTSAGSVVTLVRNPHYATWSSSAQPAAFPDEVAITRVKHTDTSAAADVDAVAKGTYDWTPDAIPDDRLAVLVKTQTGQLHPYGVSGVYYVFLNTASAPFDDVRVRRAVNLAVDRAAGARAFGGPLAAVPTCQVLPPTVLGYSPYCPYTLHPGPGGQWTAPDLDAARSLVRTAGAGGARVSVLSSRSKRDAAQVVVTAMRSIGLDATLRVHPADGVATADPEGDYYAYVAESSHHVQAGTEGWFLDYPEASAMFPQVLRCDAIAAHKNPDESMFCDRSTDAEMDVALGLQPSDPTAAAQRWAGLDRDITDLAPWVPLANTRAYDVVSSRVGNYLNHPLLGMLFDQAWVQ